jgi:hypothetical protein
VARRNVALQRYLLREPRGPVGADLTRRAIRVRNVARVYCPVAYGRLRSSLTYTDPMRMRGGLVVQVGTNVKYSLAVHEGSGSPYAPFSWRVAHARGRPVPARRFLTNALPAGRG